ncbi:MAG: glycosyltransferase family A protein [Gammaproteobacteria bacterium]
MSRPVNVIIPTLASRPRAASLSRAIDSVVSQAGIESRVLVIINGTRFDPALRTQLESDERLCVHYEALGSLPNAISVGRDRVTGTFFCFLDDDDELVPGSLAARLEIATGNPEYDFFAFNGYYREHPSGQLRTYFDGFGVPPEAMFEALLRMNWLASCGGLFRTDRVPGELFKDLPKYYEWTTVAFRLMAAGLQGRVVDQPAFIVNETPDSLSRTDSFVEGAPHALLQLLELGLPRRIRRGVREKLANAYHALSVLALERGDKALARRFHRQSLLASAAAVRRYLLYSRRLL